MRAGGRQRRASKAARDLLDDIDVEGGRAMTIRGPYGQGKTFSLHILAAMALESGLVVAMTEIDAAKNQLTKPHRVVHDLLRGIRFPGSATRGHGAGCSRGGVR